MKKTKQLLLLAFVSAVVTFMSIGSFAYTIDGRVDYDGEWGKANVVDVSQDTFSGCYIENMFVRYDFQPEKDVLFVSLQTIERKAVENYNNCSFEISINDSEPIVISPNGAEYDENAYSVSAAMKNLADGVSMEAKIVFNIGVDDKINFKFTATDSHGEKSKQFKILMQEFQEPVSTTAEQSSSKSNKLTRKETTKKSAIAESKAEEYHTVNPDEYITLATAQSDYDTLPAADESTTLTDAEENENSKTAEIVVKTVSAGVVLAAVAVLITTLRSNRKV
ncbi:MAG: hypothetical protein IJS17_02410 [Clostridia bacterium]|nr:hypothetical protein [Clostridia bacterium]